MTRSKITWSDVPADANIAITHPTINGGTVFFANEDNYGNVRSCPVTIDTTPVIDNFTVIERRPKFSDKWLATEYEQLGLILAKGDKIFPSGEVASFAWRHHEADQPRDDYHGEVELDDSGYWKPLIMQNPGPSACGDTIAKLQLSGTYGEHPTLTSVDILNQAVIEQGDRAATYDSPGGERSMGKTVAMFNILHGFNMTEEQGWQFMELLKMVRSSQGNFKLDNYVDGSSYASLAGESALRDRGGK